MRSTLVAVVFLAAALVGFSLGCAASAAEPADKSKADKPVLVEAGEFTKIYDPSVGESQPWYINDHCFAFGPDGLFHLFGITAHEPAKPMYEHHFAHATAKTLLQQPWDKRPFALSVAMEKPWNEVHLWAPYVLFHDGTYYMYYCAGDNDHTRYKIHLATSPDLKKWTRHPENPMVVDGFDARDPFVLHLRDTWVLYYTATRKPEGGNHVVAYATSDDLVHWKKQDVAFVDKSKGKWGGPCESPFVVRRGTQFYLFIGPRDGSRPAYNGTDVYVSTNPMRWKRGAKVGHIPAHAAEVVRDVDGKWYVSHCGWGNGGVYLAPLIWHDGLDDAKTNIAVPGKDEPK